MRSVGAGGFKISFPFEALLLILNQIESRRDEWWGRLYTKAKSLKHSHSLVFSTNVSIVLQAHLTFSAHFHVQSFLIKSFILIAARNIPLNLQTFKPTDPIRDCSLRIIYVFTTFFLFFWFEFSLVKVRLINFALRKFQWKSVLKFETYLFTLRIESSCS